MVKEEISAAQLMCKAADCLEKQAIQPYTPPSKAPLTFAQKTRQASPAWEAAKTVPGSLLQGLRNTGNAFVGGLETVAGGIGTLGAGAAAAKKTVDNPAGADAAWDIANQMGRFTGAGAKNFRDALFNIKGPNHVTKMQQEVMARGGMSPTTQRAMRGILGGGRLAGEGAAYLAGPGLVNAGVRGAVGGARAATGGGRLTGAVSGMGSRGATQLNNATQFKAIPQALKTLWSPAGRRAAGITAAAIGGEEAYSAGRSALDAYRSPWLPRDISRILGADKAQELEIQLRDSAKDVATDYFTPGFLRSNKMNPLDKEVGDTALEYGVGRGQEALADYLGKAKPTLPTGAHLTTAAAKRLAGQYVPRGSSDLIEALRKIPGIARRAAGDVSSSNLIQQALDVGRVTVPAGIEEAGEMSQRAYEDVILPRLRSMRDRVGNAGRQATEDIRKKLAPSEVSKQSPVPKKVRTSPGAGDGSYGPYRAQGRIEKQAIDDLGTLGRSVNPPAPTSTATPTSTSTPTPIPTTHYEHKDFKKNKVGAPEVPLLQRLPIRKESDREMKDRLRDADYRQIPISQLPSFLQAKLSDPPSPKPSESERGLLDVFAELGLSRADRLARLARNTADKEKFIGPIYKSAPTLGGQIAPYYKNVPGGFEGAINQAQQKLNLRRDPRHFGHASALQSLWADKRFGGGEPGVDEGAHRRLSDYPRWVPEDLGRPINTYHFPPYDNVGLPLEGLESVGGASPGVAIHDVIPPRLSDWLPWSTPTSRQRDDDRAGADWVNETAPGNWNSLVTYPQQQVLQQQYGPDMGKKTPPTHPHNISAVPAPGSRIQGTPTWVQRGLPVAEDAKGRTTFETPVQQNTMEHELTHSAIGGRRSSNPRTSVAMDPASWSATGAHGDALDFHQYASTPTEMDPRLAEIKRSYAATTGRLVNSPEEAERAWEWWREKIRQAAPNDELGSWGPQHLRAFELINADPVERAAALKRMQELVRTDPREEHDKISEYVNRAASQGDLIDRALRSIEKQGMQPYTPPSRAPAVPTPKTPLTLAQKTRQESPTWSGAKGFAGGLLGGLKNDADIVSNAATTAVGLPTTLASSVPAAYEGARNFVTGRKDNVSAQTMKNLAEQTWAALKGVWSGVANAADPSQSRDYRKEVADRMLDEGNASDSTRSWVDSSRLAGDIASNFAVGGVTGAPTTAVATAPVRALGNVARFRRAAALSALTKASPSHLVSMVRSSVPTASSAATGINALRQGQGLRGALGTARTALRSNNAQALARAQRHPILNYPLRPVGLHTPQGMAGPLQSAWRGTGVPALTEMAKRVPGVGRPIRAVQNAVTKLRGGVPGASTPLANPVYQYPAYEAANELWRRGLDKGIVSALGESTTFTPKETYGIHLDDGATPEEALAEITRRFAVKDTEPKDPAQIPFGYGPFNMLGGRPILDSLAGSSNFEPVPESPEEVAAYVGTLHQALDDIITPEWIQKRFNGEDGGISIQDIMNDPQHGYPTNGLPEEQQKWWQEEIIPLVKAKELGKVVQELHGVNPAQARRVKEVLDSL